MLYCRHVANTSERGNVKTTHFKATLLDGHKEAAVEVPFDPAAQWAIPATSLRRGRRGHHVKGSLNGVNFEGVIVPRARKFFLLVDEKLQEAAQVKIGDTVKVTLGPREAATWETVREIARKLPRAEEGSSYGTPAFKVQGKLFVRFHQSGESIVIHIHMNERDALMKLDPQTFYITDHYLNYPYVLVRLATVRPDVLRQMLVESWRRSAPAKLSAAYKPEAE